MKLGRGCQGQEGQRDDLPEDTHSTHPRPSVRRGVATGQDAPGRGCRGLQEGRLEERARNGAASRLSSVAVKLLIWGSRRPTPRGKAAEGAVWVKMNVKEKSTGVPDAWGSRRRGRSERKIRRAVQNQAPDMGLALPKRRPTKKTRWIEVPDLPDMGLEHTGQSRTQKRSSRYGARTHD